MADFCKEYLERTEGAQELIGWVADFSIEEEFKKLKPGYYVSMICEGYGFVGIMRTEDDECKLIFRSKMDSDEMDLVSLDKLNDRL